MVKKYLPFHQFKKINESIVSEMMVVEDTCITFDLPSVNDMVASSVNGYYHDSNCEIYFYLPKYGEEPIIVLFEVSFSFDERFDPGDYYQPPDYEILNENLDIYIQDIVMENYDTKIDLSSGEVKELEYFIENLLTD
jgi:hypothetical protein